MQIPPDIKSQKASILYSTKTLEMGPSFLESISIKLIPALSNFVHYTVVTTKLGVLTLSRSKIKAHLEELLNFIRLYRDMKDWLHKLTGVPSGPLVPGVPSLPA